jgi:hypothetical protein
MERITIDQQTVSRLPSAESLPSSNSRKALILRSLLALFTSYRLDQYADPDGFKTIMGAVLEGYPNEVVIYVCDPRTGIQRRCKWPPTVSEIVEACDDHRDFLERAARPKAKIPPHKYDSRWDEKPQGALANVFIPEGHPRYAGLVEKVKDLGPMWWRFGNSSDGRPGIFIPLNIWDGSGLKGAAA